MGITPCWASESVNENALDTLSIWTCSTGRTTNHTTMTTIRINLDNFIWTSKRNVPLIQSLPCELCCSFVWLRRRRRTVARRHFLRRLNRIDCQVLLGHNSSILHARACARCSPILFGWADLFHQSSSERTLCVFDQFCLNVVYLCLMIIEHVRGGGLVSCSTTTCQSMFHVVTSRHCAHTFIINIVHLPWNASLTSIIGSYWTQTASHNNFHSISLRREWGRKFQSFKMHQDVCVLEWMDSLDSRLSCNVTID